MGFGGGGQKRKKVDGEDTEEEDEDELVVVPPDGGWGWVIVFGSFMIHVIADGISYSFGVVIKELLIEFEEGKGPTSWIVSILIGVTLASGPIASAITNRFGCRSTTMVGGVIATIGSFLSYFGGSVFFLIITMGVITGLGFGLMYCPAIIIVTVYFEKRRALATGIAVAGAGVGTLIFPPLTAYLMEMYTWRGTFFIYSGIILNCVVFGALFRPPPTVRASTLKNGGANGKTKTVNGIHSDADDGHAQFGGQILDAIAEEAEELEKRTGMGQSGTESAPETRIGSPKQNPTSAIEQTPEIVVSSHDDLRLARAALLNRQTSVPENQAASTAIAVTNGDRERFFSSELVNNGAQHLQPNSNRSAPKNHLGGVPAHSWSVMPGGGSRTAIANALNPTTNAARRRGASECHHTAFGHGAAVLNRKDIFYPGSVTNLPEYKSNPQLYRSQISLHRPPSVTHDGPSSTAIVPAIVNDRPDYYHELPAAARMSHESGISRKSQSGGRKNSLRGIWKDIREAMKQMVDMRILSDPLFILFAVSNFLTSVGMTPPLVFLPDRASHMGMENDDYLLSIYGIFNTLGRLAIGWASDQRWANRLLIYNISLSIGGLGTILSFLCKTFGWLSAYAGFYGVSLSAYISLTSVILVDLVGLDLLTNAFGLMLLFQGIASLVGAPIAGTIADITGNYDGSFFFAGAVILASGLMLFPLPCVQRWLQRRDEKKFNKLQPQQTELLLKPSTKTTVEA